MDIEAVISRLVPNDELPFCRLGLLGLAAPALSPRFAETVELEVGDHNGPACELVLVDARQAEGPRLRTAASRLVRDGLVLAIVGEERARATARRLFEFGTDWSHPFGDGRDRIVAAGLDIHPSELGLTEDSFCPPRPECRQLPQNRADRQRRRFVRRRGRDRLIALARLLAERHGPAVQRVVEGVEDLVGERPPRRGVGGRRPGMMSVPGLSVAPWPNPDESPRLRSVVDACNRLGPAVCKELRGLIATQELHAYLVDDYNAGKFQLGNPNEWQALRLVDWRDTAAALPSSLRATHRLLGELGNRISGEVNVLRIGPETHLPLHHDDYDCEQYLHLGLTVPPGCGIRVGGETREWLEGRAVVFSPAFAHEVWNTSCRPRDVVAIDLWHADLSDLEIAALRQVRNELEMLRHERARAQGRA